MDNQKDLSPDVVLSCLQCLEASTTISDDFTSNASIKLNKYLEICAEIFISQVCRDFNKFEDPISSKVSVNVFGNIFNALK